MRKLTRLVLARKRLVVALWVLLTIVGFGASDAANKALDQQFSVPGREGWEATVAIVERYGNGGETVPLLAVTKLPEGTRASAAGVRAQLLRLEGTMRETLPAARVAGYGSTGDRTFVSDDGRVAFAYAFLPQSDATFNSQAASVTAMEQGVADVRIAGAPVRVSGYDALNEGSGGSEGTGVLVEALLAGAAALVVLIFVFGSFLALAPLMMAICAIPAAFLLLLGMSQFTELSPILQFLVPIIGLGISIDYSLLIVIRWREERDNGASNDEAVETAMATAGRAVVFSGTTVAVGLLALVVVPVPFLRSMGYGGLLIPLVATASAITLLPVVLSRLGPALDKRRVSRRKASDHPAWGRWARGVVRRRVAAVIVAVAILVALTIPATGMNLGNPDPDTMAKSGEAKVALTQLEDSGIGSGAIAPVETLVPTADAGAVRTAQANVEGVHGAVAPVGPDWRKGGDALVVAVPNQADSSQAGRDAIAGVTDASHEASPDALVGGSGPVNRDFIDAVYGSFPLLLAVLSLVTFVLLARAFRSVVLPLKAVVLNILSIGATLGLMTLVWQEGHGSKQLWDIAATGSITSWIPFMVFALLYGLSMDYEVFILSRMREAHDAGAETDEAVITGLSRTGRLVTSAALILFFAFAALATGPAVDVKVLATALAAGILLDATIIRALLVPAAVSLFGKWNWWLPPGFARLLRVAPSDGLQRPGRVRPADADALGSAVSRGDERAIQRD